ncbi:hypothetical protein BDR07DRAFT_1443292 [Suillus spraguei]|nr:hypothetical protein BDR07DRAFT_1443292 [Suillus spraguei]
MILIRRTLAASTSCCRHFQVHSSHCTSSYVLEKFRTRHAFNKVSRIGLQYPATEDLQNTGPRIVVSSEQTTVLHVGDFVSFDSVMIDVSKAQTTPELSRKWRPRLRCPQQENRDNPSRTDRFYGQNDMEHEGGDKDATDEDNAD